MGEEEADEGREMGAAVHLLFPGVLRRSLIRYVCDLPHTHFGRLPNPWFQTQKRLGISLEPHQTLLVSNNYVTTTTRPLMQSENEKGQRGEEEKIHPSKRGFRSDVDAICRGGGKLRRVWGRRP